MSKEEKQKQINDAIEYYKNSTDENASIYLNRKYHIYTTKFADLKSRKNGES